MNRLIFVIFLFIGLLGLNFDTEAQIVTLKSWSSEYNGTANYSASYTIPPGTNSLRVLVVGIATSTQTAASRSVTLTYGGQALTSVDGNISENSRQHTQLYYLNEAGLNAATNTTLSFTVSGGTTALNTIFAAVYDNVDQTNPVTNSQYYSNTATTFQFATALTIDSSDLAIKILSSVRTGSTNFRTISNFGTNWTADNQQTGSYNTTGTTNDLGIRNAVGTRSISFTDITDVSSTTMSGPSLISMTGMSLNVYTPPPFSPSIVNWYFPQWSYRKGHIIYPATGAGTDYQVMIKVKYASGSDYTNTVYCNSKCQTDFGDIRFASEDGTELSYWMQSKANSDSAVFWVEINGDLSNAAKKIYMYYGNVCGSVATTSDGPGTFIYFDDGASLTGWTQVDATNTGISTTVGNPVNSFFVINKAPPAGGSGGGGQWYMYKSIPGLGANTFIFFNVRTEPGNLGNLNFLCNSSGAGQHFRLDTRGTSGYSGFATTSAWNTWNAPGASTTAVGDTWYQLGVKINAAADRATLYFDQGTSTNPVPGTVLNGTTYAITNNGTYIGLGGDAVPGGPFYTYWDNIGVRKCAPVEPAHGAWGLEQTSYVWNQTGTASWQTATNWTPTRTTPASTDILQFTCGNTTTVTNVSTETIAQLIISNPSATTINLQPASSPNSLTINDYLKVAQNDVLNLGTGVILDGTLSTVNNDGTIQISVLTATSITPIPTGKNWTGTIEYNGGDQTVVNGTYTNLTLSGTGTKSLPSSGTTTISGNFTLSGTASTAVDNDITVAGNMSLTSTNVLSVNATKSLSVAGTITNNGTITVKSPSSGGCGCLKNDSSVTGSGTLNVERYVTGGTHRPYHYISVPLKDQPYWKIRYSGDYVPYWYDETVVNADLDNGWTAVRSGNLTVGRGYAVVSQYASRTFNYSFTGANPVETFPYNKTVTYTATTGGPAWAPKGIDPQGWNLIGNPFTCPMNASTFLTDNALKLDTAWGGIYFWDDLNGTINRSQDYAVFNLTGGTAAAPGNSSNAPNGTITNAQAFFIKVNSSATNVTFNPSQRTSSSSTQFFVPDFSKPVGRFWLGIYNPDDLYNEILIGFTNYATMGIDHLWDSRKLKGNPNIALYSLLNNKEYAIQAFPELKEELVVELGLNIGTSGTHVFKVANTENFNVGDGVLLVDKYLNTITNLIINPEYRFYSDKGVFNNRFELVFLPARRVQFGEYDTLLKENHTDINSNMTGQDVASMDEKENEPSNPIIYMYNNNIYINSPENYFADVSIFDISGKLVFKSNTEITYNTIITLNNLSNGLYMLKLSSIKGNFVKKLVF